ncbi:uncharacterized protein BX664DRAFT_320110 [Halteromyces radiatus]|uniref:uncharacterized protein n=1 Tax=Halteromyces radiatus TaxID=101107 RepID=UPI002220AD9B|nr:uncharacterized protein BX664DRAFT_320110 [Halteromyces radiatus]KAI8098991.1 hypothetical protein BX664DRAFT_320110 [Halteromyces radiatus]
MLGSDLEKTLEKNTIRLIGFLQECSLLGSLSGFRYFEVCMRSREELLLCISPPGNVEQRKRPLTIMSSTYLLDEDYIDRHDCTVFMVTGYAVYNCPYIYAWKQSNQSLRYMTSPVEPDVPLRLESTLSWNRKHVALWEMVWELLSRLTWPSPTNPFAIDFDYLDRLPLPQSLLLIGGLLDFLQTLWVQAEPQVSFINQVFEDIQLLQQRHLQLMRDYTHKINVATPST